MIRLVGLIGLIVPIGCGLTWLIDWICCIDWICWIEWNAMIGWSDLIELIALMSRLVMLRELVCAGRMHRIWFDCLACMIQFDWFD